MTVTNGHTIPKMTYRHPLEQLTAEEVNVAREAVLDARKAAILFRNTFTVEPAKTELVKFLAAEHAGTLTPDTPRPTRQARVQYDVVFDDRSHEYMESIVDIASGKEVEHRRVPKTCQQALTFDEFKEFNDVCVQSEMFKDAVKDLKLDEKFEIAIDPWPYGGPDAGEIAPRYVCPNTRKSDGIDQHADIPKVYASQSSEMVTPIVTIMASLSPSSPSWTHTRRRLSASTDSPLAAQKMA